MVSKHNAKIIEDYLKQDYDFGFSSVSEIPLQQEVQQTKASLESLVEEAAKKEATVESLKQRLKDTEMLIMPFLANLLNADKDFIYWPAASRKVVLEDNIEKLLKLTRD